MKCCVVGCGAAGIIASKHLKADGIEYDAFESTDDIGGTWIYTEKKVDRFGTPVHTSMYKNLRTNLPKEIMEFEGFKYDTEKSFLTWQEVLEYLKTFVEKFDLMDNIKLGHMVNKISRKENSWEVTIVNKENSETFIVNYDAIFVCNGHYSQPSLPSINGMKDFEGAQIHSKNYRTPEKFKNQTILVIGFGPSGQDITADVSSEAKTVFLSHHAPNFKEEFFKKNVFSKPDVKNLNANSVTFMDGSTEDIDAIIYCTGYNYDYPFMDTSCGLLVENNYIKPLLHQFININNPTMVLIGVPFRSFIFPLFEMQVKAFIKTLLNPKILPTQEEMMKELEKFENSKIEEGISQRKYHQLSNIQEYIGQIRSVGNLPDLPTVLYDIYDLNYQHKLKYFNDYRNVVYRILNDKQCCHYITSNT